MVKRVETESTLLDQVLDHVASDLVVTSANSEVHVVAQLSVVTQFSIFYQGKNQVVLRTVQDRECWSTTDPKSPW